MFSVTSSCVAPCFPLVTDIEFESAIAAWASVFALKTTHAQLVV